MPQRKYKRQNEYDSLLEGGEDAAAEDKPKSEKQEDDKKSEQKEENDDDPYPEPVLEECCCCDCVCANTFTQGYTCCLCMPIKCGVVAIGVVTLLVTFIMFIWYFFLFMNEYLHWWYTMVCCILLIPLLLASNFIITFFTKDTKVTRALLFTSQILALISVLLVCVWNIIYFLAIYKKDTFYSGMGDIDKNIYVKQSKKVFLFTMLAETVILTCCFTYFICVASTYQELMHGEGAYKDEEKPDKGEDKK